jgi:hypothetical protein
MAVSLFIFNSDMKFLKTAVILFLLIAVLDFALGKLLHHYYFKEKYGKDAEMTHVFTKVNADVIITGSSRARRNYDPVIIGDSLQLSCYNGGHDGQSLFYDLALMRTLIGRYQPKLVVVDLLPEEIYYNPVHYDRLSVLLPYYQDFPEVRGIVKLRGEDTSSLLCKFLHVNKEKIKLLSGIYPYNSTLYDIIIGHAGKEDYALNGFYPLPNTLTIDEEKEIAKQYNQLYSKPSSIIIDRNKVNCLKEIITICKQNNIKVVIVFSPIYEDINRGTACDTLKAISTEYAVPLLDYTLDKEFHDLNYFADNHMNYKGADFFSAQLGHDLKKYIAPSK